MIKKLVLVLLASCADAVKILQDDESYNLADSSIEADKSSNSTNSTSQPNSSSDSSSYANVDEILTQNIALDLSVDMSQKLVSGNVVHKMKVIKPTDKVILDFQGLEIQKVEFIGKDGAAKALNSNQSSPSPDIGSKLTINLPEQQKQDAEFDIKVTYKSTKDAKAFRWVDADRTTGKSKGLMFTQCQPIACRSLAPMQDTPVYKVPYSAMIAVDQGYTAKMSAIGDAAGGSDDSGRTKFQFKQDIAIPSYLIALVVGDLETKKIGERVNIIAEPGMINEVQNQLMDLGSFLSKTESYLTPYVWGDYNILILPSAMPDNIAGMENPLLTIAAPEMVTGSTVTVAMHELVHSWFGNLLTCKTWSDFWLNESFTVFTERKMTGQIFGKSAAKWEAFSGNAYLETDLKKFGGNSPYSALKMQLPQGTNPELSQSNVQYEKGYQFLSFLEDTIGEKNFQSMLREYILAYQYKSVTTEDFVNTFKSFVEKNMKDQSKDVLSKIDFHKWIYEAGDPPKKFDDNLITDIEGAS